MKSNKIPYNDFRIRRCSLDDIDNILALQDDVFRNLVNKEWLRKNNKETFIKCIDDPNITLGVFLDTELIAIIIMYAIHDEEDLSRSLVNTKVNKSANFKLILVDENYRGNGLMKSLMWVLEKYAYKTGHLFLCSTADKDNIYSVNNLINSNYKKDSSVIKYDGLERELYVKDIEKSQKEYIDSLIGLFDFEKIKKYCLLGDISIANYGDLVECDNKLGIILFNNKVKFGDGEIIEMNRLDNLKVWINTNYENI